MLNNGWSKKRRQAVVARKQTRNEHSKRHAAKRSEREGRDIAPFVVAEETNNNFSNPMGHHAAAGNANRDFKALMSGEDLPERQRPTNISKPKTDLFMEWMTGACQFRPGNLRKLLLEAQQTNNKAHVCVCSTWIVHVEL
jgi:hypothetical protein